MRKTATAALLSVGILGLTMFQASGAQGFATNHRAHGSGNGSWAFMTAWNLSTGSQSVSPQFIGLYEWTFSMPARNQWTAKFVYDQGLLETTQLRWSYTQGFIQ